MGHPSSVDVGCNSTKQFEDTLKIEDADVRNFIKGLPDEVKIPDSVPVIGGKPIKVKENVKTILDSIKDNPVQPTLVIRFTVQGNCDNFDSITIEVASHRIDNVKSGSVTVAGVGIDVSLDAEISPEHMVKENCKCSNGADGERQKRNFHITWVLHLSVNPGVGGSFPIAEYDVAVYSCCCQNFDDDDDDGDGEDNGGDEGPDDGENDEPSDGEDDDGDDDEESDYEILRPSAATPVYYRETRALMPRTLEGVFEISDDKQHEESEEEQKKKAYDEAKKKKEEEKQAKKNKDKNKKKQHHHHEEEQGGAEHTTNKSKSKEDKHQKGQRHKNRKKWEKKRKKKNWTPFGKGKKHHHHEPQPPKPPEKPPSGETPHGGGSSEHPPRRNG